MTDRPIPIEEWQWFGHPLHFISADSCQFRMGTLVGAFVVSTVGDYYGDGDTEPRQLGCDRLFETMVFHADGHHPCGCPDIDPRYLYCSGSNDAETARGNHMETCRMAARGEFDDD